MSKSHQPYVTQIRESITAIQAYRPEDLEALNRDPKAWDAIMMRLQVIGEGFAQIRALDEERFAEHAPDAWRNAIAVRNVISHGYLSIQPDVVWRIITEDLPNLESSLSLLDTNTFGPGVMSRLQHHGGD